MRFHLIISHEKYEARLLARKCEEILRFEAVHTIVKTICAKTILSGQTIILSGSALNETGKILNNSNKIAQFYGYSAKLFKEII